MQATRLALAPLELASGGLERRIFVADSGPIDSTEAEAFDVPLRGHGQLVIRSAKIGTVRLMMTLGGRRHLNGRCRNQRSYKSGENDLPHFALLS